MVFAIIFLIFFTLDVLVFFQFLFFGLIPERLLFMAVGFFTLWVMISNRSLIIQKRRDPIFYGWILAIGGMIYDRMNCIVFDFWRLFGLQGLDDRVFYPVNSTLVLLSLSVLILSFKLMNKKHGLYKWYLFTGFALVFKSLLDLLIVYPQWLYRYAGFTDLPIMFGWLMIVSQIIHMKVDRDV
jgi:hypothetical protein